jgi:hypothetical protein
MPPRSTYRKAYRLHIGVFFRSLPSIITPWSKFDFTMPGADAKILRERKFLVGVL